MTVTHLWSGGKTWTASGSGYEQSGNFYDGDNLVDLQNEKALKQLLTFGVLCNHSELIINGDEVVIDGDPTEGALLIAALKPDSPENRFLNNLRLKKNTRLIRHGK